MKKFILINMLVVLIFSSGTLQAFELYNDYSVKCLKGNKVCFVGDFTLSTSGSKPLIVKDNIVCTPDRRTCINGYWVLSTNKAENI